MNHTVSVPNLETISFAHDHVDISMSGVKGEYIFDYINKTQNFYELDVLSLIARIPLPEGIFVDAGANIGNHTVFFSKVLKRKTYSFEVSPDIRNILSENCASNNLDALVTIFGFGLYSRDTSAVLHHDIDNLGKTRVDHIGDAGVPLRTLDSLVSSDENIALIKIDVEGAELDVLAGARCTIERCQPVCIVEVHGANAASQTSAFFTQIGYVPAGIAGNSDNWIMAPQKAAEIIGRYVDVGLRRHNTRELSSLRALVSRGNAIHDTTQGRADARADKLLGSLEAVASQVGQLDSGLTETQASIANAIGSGHKELSDKLQGIQKGIAGRITDAEKNLSDKLQYALLGPDGIAKRVETLTNAAIAANQRERVEVERLRKLNSQLGSRFRQDAEALRKQIGTKERALEIKEAQRRKLTREIDQAEKRIRALQAQGQTLDRMVEAWRDHAREMHGTKGAAAQRFVLQAASKLGLKKRMADFASVERDIARRASIQAAIPSPIVSADDPGPQEAVNDTAEATVETTPAAKPTTAPTTPPIQVNFPEAKSYRARPDGRVRVGIATIPSREVALEQTIACLLPQADEIFVALNGHETVPEFLKHEKITVVLQENIGDKAKFQFLDGFDGYYFTCDDDIIYPEYYIDYCIYKIEEYKRSSVVGWHGSIIEKNFEFYYERKSRKVYTFGSRQAEDRFVHILGTGISAFHTDTLRPSADWFPAQSLADIYFALEARKRHIPLLQIAHDSKQAVAIEIEDDVSISSASIDRVESSLNVGDKATELVKASMPFLPPNYYSDLEYRPIRVALVGRTSPQRWRQGGIHKSCGLMAKQIERFGGHVTQIEIEDSLEETKTILKAPYDVAIFYTGDQIAQDYFPVEELIASAVESGKMVLANLSYNLRPDRTKQIVEFMERVSSERLHLMAFSPEVRNDRGLGKFAEQVVVVPKTIEPARVSEATFADRSGVFIGDVAKLANPDLTPDASQWLDTVRQTLPGERIVAINQYHGSRPLPDFLEGVEIVPAGDVYAVFEKMRLYVHLPRFCTFEMMPVEAMASGLPVAHIDMPQSLNHYIGPYGLRFSSASELQFALRTVYRKEQIWTSLRDGGIHQGAALVVDRTSGWLSTSLMDLASKNSRIE
ncbi:FkbM family methyltransferase [Neoaquamicrobium sediminum]|uniref:FkbM family methyltransferase n=1 Tax=Neoaquamicrobium sediminum TaxID=1849104 RepID=A0ABV3X0J9_9HYPH